VAGHGASIRKNRVLSRGFAGFQGIERGIIGFFRWGVCDSRRGICRDDDIGVGLGWILCGLNGSW
jgi:hypothetical protein